MKLMNKPIGNKLSFTKSSKNMKLEIVEKFVEPNWNVNRKKACQNHWLKFRIQISQKSLNWRRESLTLNQ